MQWSHARDFSCQINPGQINPNFQWPIQKSDKEYRIIFNRIGTKTNFEIFYLDSIRTQ